MKKILSILFAGVIALMATSCLPDENFATFDPSKATAPVVGAYEMSTKALTVEYTPGKFNMGFNEKMPVNHMLVMTSVDGKAVNKVIATTNKDNVLTASVSALSNALVGLGYKEDDSVNFEAIVRATMQNPAQDNGRNGHVDSKDKVSVNGFVVVFPKGSPYQEYTAASPFSVIGSLSEYGISWDGDLEMWMTEDGNLHVAKCVSLKADDEFKFRKDQDWGVNYGGDYGSLDTPFSVSQDGPNVKVGKDGLYDLWLDIASGTATVTEAYQAYPDHKEASNWTVIGSLSEYGISWDGDIEMVTDGTTHIAQAVKLTADDEFKFRQDKDWAVNLGGDFGGLGSDFSVSQDGPNVKVGAKGIYDLIVNPGAGTAQVVETMGGGKSGKIGGDEPGPEPEPITGWNIIGLNGDWDNDVIATNSGSIWTVYITAPEATEFKFRKDGAWAENIGGVMEAVGEPFEAVVDGNNIQIGAGFWKVVLDTEAMTITITNGEVWSLIGDFNGWAADVDMELVDGKWVSPATQLNENGFKIRHNHDWAESLGGTFEAFGTPFAAVSEDGPNIMLPAAGEYFVTYDPEAQTITVVKSISGWNVIGVNGNWDEDVIATENNGVWSVRVNVPESTQFKWRKDGGWTENIGGVMVEPGTPFEGSQDGPNIELAPGFWLLTLDMTGAVPMLTVSDGEMWSVIGDFNGWAGDVEMVKSEGVWTSPAIKLTAGGGFKIRHNYDWTLSVGGTLVNLGEPFAAVSEDGPNIVVPEDGTYIIAYDTNDGTITVSAAGWGVVGTVNGWGNTPDIVMKEEAGKSYLVARNVTVTASDEIKIRKNNDWAAGDYGADSYLGHAVKAVKGGSNIKPGIDGAVDVYFFERDEVIIVAAAGEAITYWGVVGTVNGWAAPDFIMYENGNGGFVYDDLVLAASDEFKIRMNEVWEGDRGGTFAALDEPFDVTNGGPNIKIGREAKVTVSYYPTDETITLSGEISGEEPELPETMYIIGDAVGGLDWAGDYIVSMIPVNGKRGQFWAIRTLEPQKGFKFCAVKEWSGDFTGLGTDTGYTVSDGNCYVEEKAVYMIYVDTENKKVCVEKAKVYGIGDCFGGWTEGMQGALFVEEDDGKLVGKTTAAGEIRLYAASSIATSDWWTREFVFFDGKIAYRGNGGDQDRVTVEAGKTVSLDFDAGTATVIQ